MPKGRGPVVSSSASLKSSAGSLEKKIVVKHLDGQGATSAELEDQHVAAEDSMGVRPQTQRYT